MVCCCDQGGAADDGDEGDDGEEEGDEGEEEGYEEAEPGVELILVRALADGLAACMACSSLRLHVLGCCTSPLAGLLSALLQTLVRLGTGRVCAMQTRFQDPYPLLFV
jgi:hypothetical protein